VRRVGVVGSLLLDVIVLFLALRFVSCCLVVSFSSAEMARGLLRLGGLARPVEDRWIERRSRTSAITKL